MVLRFGVKITTPCVQSGNFFYHAHSLEQCPPAPTCAKDSNQAAVGMGFWGSGFRV